MNEKIKALAEQASIHFDTSKQSRIHFISTDTLDKFAELIVKECQVALHPMLRDQISRGQAYNLIKQHFGVEE